MTKVSSYIHGIFPRSNTLAQTTRDVGRNRQTLSDLKKQQRKDFDSLIALQKALSFDYIEDGKLNWQDIFRPIVESTQNLEVGALTRWFDNNSFFRQPIIKGELKLNLTKLADFVPQINLKTAWKITLPSPFSFAKLSEHQNFENALEQVTEILKQAILFYEKKGVSLVQFNEPSLPYYGATEKEKKLFIKALKSIYEAKKSSKLSIQFYFGDASPIFEALSNVKIADIIGIDFYRTDLKSLPKNFPYQVAAGILESRNSLLDDEKILYTFVNNLIKKIKPEEIFLTNNSDLDLLPESVAQKKLELLGRLKRKF